MSGAPTPEQPTSAGMYDYFLGGTNNTAADRAACDLVKQAMPDVSDVCWANRGFLQRAVRWMAAEKGIRQFIDLGPGLPTVGNTHEVVNEVTSGGRVVYADVDPDVIEMGQKILGGVPGTALIQADMREAELILSHPETRGLIDFNEPVGLLMVGVLKYIPDAEDPWGMVARYVDAVPSGSYLAATVSTADLLPPEVTAAVRDIYASSPHPYFDRPKADVERFFTGLEIVAPYPGARPEVTYSGQWGADDPDAADSDGSRWQYVAVARKP